MGGYFLFPAAGAAAGENAVVAGADWSFGAGWGSCAACWWETGYSASPVGDEIAAVVGTADIAVVVAYTVVAVDIETVAAVRECTAAYCLQPVAVVATDWELDFVVVSVVIAAPAVWPAALRGDRPLGRSFLNPNWN